MYCGPLPWKRDCHTETTWFIINLFIYFPMFLIKKAILKLIWKYYHYCMLCPWDLTMMEWLFYRIYSECLDHHSSFLESWYHGCEHLCYKQRSILENDINAPEDIYNKWTNIRISLFIQLYNIVILMRYCSLSGVGNEEIIKHNCPLYGTVLVKMKPFVKCMCLIRVKVWIKMDKEWALD